MEWAHAPEVGLPRPDLVVYLDLDLEEAQKRGGFGEEKYEKTEMQRRVKEIFLHLNDKGTDEGQDMFVVNAGGTVEEVGSAVLHKVLDKVALVESGAQGNEIRRVRAWTEANRQAPI